MRKVVFAALCGAVCFLAGSCGGSSASGTGDVPVIDMEALVDVPAFMDIEIDDVIYTPLDTATDALLGDRPVISAIAGDTVIIREMGLMGENSHLVLFSLSDGHFIRNISHCGQGPGEYTWIESVFVDRPSQQMVIRGAGGSASRYTLSDSLVEAYPSYNTRNTKFSAGSIARGINIPEVVDGNMLIHQLNSKTEPVDTLIVENYDPMYISMAYNTSGEEALMNVVDTMYTLLPGKMEPVAVLSRGGKALTPQVEKDVYLNQKDYKITKEKRSKYIEFNYFLSDGEHLMIYSAYGGNFFIDIFSRKTGAHLGRNIMSYADENSGFAIEWKGVTFLIQNLFYVADGRFYALVSHEQTVDAEGNPAPDGNLGVISFRLAPKQ